MRCLTPQIMVKLFSNQSTFAHPFEICSLAFLRKYPNFRAPHVKSVDTYEREINKEGYYVGFAAKLEHFFQVSSFYGELYALKARSLLFCHWYIFLFFSPLLNANYNYTITTIASIVIIWCYSC